MRLPSTPRDDLRPLYLNTQGLYVGKTSELLVVREGNKVLQEVRLREINQVNVFGNIQLSTQAFADVVLVGDTARDALAAWIFSGHAARHGAEEHFCCVVSSFGWLINPSVA